MAMKKRLAFDSQGKLASIDGRWINRPGKESSSSEDVNSLSELKTSASLTFLQQSGDTGIHDTSGWSLYADNKPLPPLQFSNGKTQEDVVNEVVSLITEGHKIIFIHGVCGTGKSAIALNIARRFGKASIVVPVKGLQRQYEEDYTLKKYLIKPDGKRLSIAMITGRENHDSIIKPGVSCADPFLPDTIRITEKNLAMVRDYYNENPLIRNKIEPLLKALKRISIAPANPHWSPIAPIEYELPLRDAKKKIYDGILGKRFVFYHRKEGCSYYDQYQAYIDADVIIFNAAKYNIEMALNRKPSTAVDIIDEADEFLDSFSQQEELNLSRFANALQSLRPERPETKEVIDRIVELIQLEEQRAKAVGIDENKIYKLEETKIPKIIELLLKSGDLEAEILIDELNYGNTALDIARTFHDFVDETYGTYRKNDADLLIQLVTTNLSRKFAELQHKTNALVLMSGTIHSPEVLREVFGIQDFKIVEAETLQQGTIEIHRTGKEIDCKYSNFTSKKYSREDYLRALSLSLTYAMRPTLVHIQSFEDLPQEQEIVQHGLQGVMSRERLISIQAEDKTGRQISFFKAKLQDMLFTTKCSRGVDFPGDVCNAIVFTKYPNPNVNSIFWKILQQTHKDYYWDFYRDKARREFLQRLYRALRSKDDHVFVLSPDSRVLDAVRNLQLMFYTKKIPFA